MDPANRSGGRWRPAGRLGSAIIAAGAAGNNWRDASETGGSGPFATCAERALVATDGCQKCYHPPVQVARNRRREAGRMKWGETWDALGGGQKLGLSVVGAILIVVLIVILLG
jgi:hypothetical protein